MNWHPKYYKYIQEWIANLLPTQIEYFEKERKRLSDSGIYH